MALVGEPGRQRDVGDTAVAGQQQGAGPADATLHHIGVHGLAHGAAEEGGRVRHRQAHHLRQGAEAQIGLQVLLDVLDEPPDLGLGEDLTAGRGRGEVLQQPGRKRDRQAVGVEAAGRDRRLQLGVQRAADVLHEGIPRAEPRRQLRLRERQRLGGVGEPLRREAQGDHLDRVVVLPEARGAGGDEVEFP